MKKNTLMSKNQRGVTMIEYALLLAVVVMVIVVAFNSSGIAAAIGALFNRVATCLSGGACT